MSNCTNPAAKNYNPSATTDDGSCIYLSKVAGTCYAFQDVDPTLITDQSFTLSWALGIGNWVFYHDYLPDFYIQTRQQLYNLKNGLVYKHNNGLYGHYHDQIKPFFIDVIFPSKDDYVLNTIEWITEALDTNGKAKEFVTITHITAWNNYQCTGRIAIAEVYDQLLESNDRKTQGTWNFNGFKDALLNNEIRFLNDIFHNFNVLPNVTEQIPWYDEQLLIDNYAIVRFEFNNIANQKLLINNVEINADKAIR